MSHESIEGGAIPIKAWTRGVPVEDSAMDQLRQTASLPFVWPHLAVMPDVHWGLGATVGSVVPTEGAIVPACVGVDIGCGIDAVRTTLTSSALGDNANAVYEAIVAAVPHGRTDDGGPNDRGAWRDPPENVVSHWAGMNAQFTKLVERAPALDTGARRVSQLGTLGTGNHFVEVCLDEEDRVWLMLHSGSRGTGNRIGTHFISIAKKEAEKNGVALPNGDLAWLREGSESFDAYVEALTWAQNYARVNRRIMMNAAVMALVRALDTNLLIEDRVSCHHNYVSREEHFGKALWVTRKGAVSARLDELGLIPGSMGARSFVVRGKGNPESFCSCSHGAGRAMSRGAAKKAISLEQHAADTATVVCRKDAGVLDESPRAYKDVDAVMAAQSDLVEVVHTLRGAVCVKG